MMASLLTGSLLRTSICTSKLRPLLALELLRSHGAAVYEGRRGDVMWVNKTSTEWELRGSRLQLLGTTPLRLHDPTENRGRRVPQSYGTLPRTYKVPYVRTLGPLGSNASHARRRRHWQALATDAFGQ